jgi:hypothetical protein
MREIGRFRIIRGRVVAIYVEDRYVDPAGPFIKADDLHAIGRMNGLGNYVRTRDAFTTIPRISYEEWRVGSGKEWKSQRRTSVLPLGSASAKRKLVLGMPCSQLQGLPWSWCLYCRSHRGSKSW